MSYWKDGEIKAFVVTGSESSGTRMMVRSFVLLDIPEVTFDRDVDWAYGDLELPKSDIVMHVGMPLGGVWHNLWEVGKRLRNEGFTPVFIVMTRDWFSTTLSQVNRKFVSSEQEALARIREAYRRITQQANEYFMVSYEYYCNEPRYRARLYEMWELPNSPIDIHFGNNQYY